MCEYYWMEWWIRWSYIYHVLIIIWWFNSGLIEYIVFIGYEVSRIYWVYLVGFDTDNLDRIHWVL